METKHCKDCDKDLPFSEFGKCKQGKYGLKFYCKKCKKIRDTLARRIKGAKERTPVFKDGEGKECTNCKTYKIFDDFFESKKMSDGRASWCKECSVDLGRKERLKKGVVPRRYRQEKDGFVECLECCLFLPKDRFSPSKRGSYGLCSYCKPCVIKLFKSDKSIQNQRAKNFRAKGTYRPAHRLRQHNRKSLIKAVDDGTITKEFTLSLLETDNCSYCKKFTDKSLRTIDHVVPLSKGGLHSSTNLAMACLSCNSTKKDLHLEEFLEKYILCQK